MSREQYHSASHCKYLTQYHIIWCPKFRYSVLTNGIDVKLKQILQDICNQYGYIIKALEIMPDHVHIFVDCPQTVAPCDIARTFKSISTNGIYLEVPNDYRASQYDHTKDDYIKKNLSNRLYNLSDGTQVQRDWYSSYLLYCFNNTEKTIDKEKCNIEFEKQLKREQKLIDWIKDNRIKILNSGIKVT